MWRYAFILLALLSMGCKKEPKAETADLHISVSYLVDGSPLLLDTIMYAHPAGYLFSINSIQYFISGIELGDVGPNYASPENVAYLDVAATKNQFILKDIRTGSYSGLRFIIGLDSTKNKSHFLPATTENFNMAWPDNMGGGYHFLKLEGNYKDSTGVHGYTMHLGINGNTVPVVLAQKTIIILAGKANVAVLKMNISEWFKNPEMYDFNIDGNYSMGVDKAMKKLVSNGADIFNE